MNFENLFRLRLSIFLVVFYSFSITLYSQSDSTEYPKTVDAAIDTLINQLSNEYKFLIKNSVKEKLITFHMSLGMYIRNNFGLWANSEIMDELRIIAKNDGLHPDEASGIILEKLSERLQKMNENYNIKVTAPIVIDSINTSPLVNQECMTKALSVLEKEIEFPLLKSLYGVSDSVLVRLDFNNRKPNVTFPMVLPSDGLFSTEIINAVDKNLYFKKCNDLKNTSTSFWIYFDPYQALLKYISTKD